MTTSRFTRLLTWAVVGTYLLVALGATTAETGTGIAATLHHGAAGAVFLLLAVVTKYAWTESRTTRVHASVTAAIVWFPIQAVIGAFGTTDGLHLLGGLFVFGSLLMGLVWQLDHEHNVDAERTEGAVEGGSVDGGAEPDETEDSHAAQSGRDHRPIDRSRIDRFDVRTRAYLELTKPRLMWLLCLLALAGMSLAAAGSGTLSGTLVVATLTGGVLAVGAAGTFNHVYERDRDRSMDRTRDRPVATQNVSPIRATAFGISLALTSMTVLLTFVNALAAALTAAAIVYYAVVYTILLKPTTTWNTVIGGGSGALPALIGWAAVTGSIGLPALLLAGIVVCWTPAHFYNFAIVYRDDYDRADYPMLPVVKGIGVTRRRTAQWLGATLAATAFFGLVVGFGLVFVLITSIAGAAFIWTLVDQYRTETDRAAFRTFHASNAYLGLLMVAVILESVVI